MSRPLQSVAILGAGAMGSRIAAHCANHGLATLLLDRTVALAQAGLRAAIESRPPAFFLPSLAAQVQIGDFSADLGAADWVVEAVVENLAAKHDLLLAVATRLAPHAALTTNTSGLPVHQVFAPLPAAVRQRAFGVHFFNPPRYMRLVEIIPTPATDAGVVAWVGAALDRRLGKGLVAARDTPNFIANRIGAFMFMNTLRLMQAHHLTVEQVDALTGPLIGLPKSASFRTLDMVGLDTLANVVHNSYRNLPDDERRDLFQIPPLLQTMLDRHWLGEKTGQGFYKKQGRDILALDVSTLEYRPRQSVRYDDLPALLRAATPEGAFLRESMAELFAYAQARIPEVADEPATIDRAMRWGYNWKFGPFELRDLLQTGKPARRRLAPSPPVPLGAGLGLPGPAPSPGVSGTPGAAALAPAPTIFREAAGCSLLDLGDGVAGLEFHGKRNILDASTVALVTAALRDLDSPFSAFVITNAADDFSAGADLGLLLALIDRQAWDEIAAAVRGFQAMTMAVKRSPRPVVVAPFGLTLGGACELALHAARVVAHAELYAGLVEVGVGLIPAGGGTKEMALRADPKTAFETIALAKLSSSAAQARQLRFLRSGDVVVANRDRVLEVAKSQALQLAAQGYEPPAPASLVAPGPSVRSTLELGAYLLRAAEQITAFEFRLARHVAHVVCAGGAPAGLAVSEDHLLDLEREAFLSLCGEPMTRERIAAMLSTGKALRN